MMVNDSGAKLKVENSSAADVELLFSVTDYYS